MPADQILRDIKYDGEKKIGDWIHALCSHDGKLYDGSHGKIYETSSGEVVAEMERSVLFLE